MSSIAFRTTFIARIARLPALRPRTDNSNIKNALAAAQRARQIQTQRHIRLQQLEFSALESALAKYNTTELLTVSEDAVDDENDKAFNKLSNSLERYNTSNLLDEQLPQDLLPLVSSAAFVKADYVSIPQVIEIHRVHHPRLPRRFKTEGLFLKKALIASAFKAEDQRRRIEEAEFTALDAALTKFNFASLLDVKEDALDDEDDKAFSRLVNSLGDLNGTYSLFDEQMPQDPTTDANEFTQLDAALKTFDNSPLLDLAFSLISVAIV